MISFLQTLENETVLDLGCGDFEVGKNFIPYINKYIAADVSKLIIEQNKKRFTDTDVEFIHLDGSKDQIPQADLVIIRQVLQHLSNDDINKILDNVRKLCARYVVITEHIPFEKQFTSNIDKPTGAGIRLGLVRVYVLRITHSTFLRILLKFY